VVAAATKRSKTASASSGPGEPSGWYWTVSIGSSAVGLANIRDEVTIGPGGPTTVTVDDRGATAITLGRDDQNDIVIADRKASRLHARVETNRNKFMLIDQSTNGTFVLGKDGEEAFVRRDSMQLRGEGLIGLGKAPDSNSSQVIRYACEE
jgi:hypothetical protein